MCNKPVNTSMLLTAVHRNCKMRILKWSMALNVQQLINFTIFLNASAKYSEVKVEVT